ncbi:M16 family metallopeptidase [Desulfosarcina ovata]|uniref:Peptidase M16 n=1 Tax=Desulfosarcina ovata subsp. ovata TaxID=2752305 RepID=A0A5K8A9G9_9BACT|nr:M16 family metallopeptidase [Desulfosarcina ovata]BBO89098.1 peptidase M16 [Desulfosarcina ovata subsp. ovata]
MSHHIAAGLTRSHRWYRHTALLTVLLIIFGGFGPTANHSGVFHSGIFSPQPAVAGPATAPGPGWAHETSDLKPDPNIVFGRLSNGFRYVLMQNQRPENRVSLHLFVHAGSLNETEDQRGVAHFLEHMLFNGSTHFPPGELIRYFQSIGMQFGNDANAHTGFNETVYDVILPQGDAQNLEKGLLVMQDYAMGALLLEEEVKRESGVILSEMRSRDSAGYRTFKATLTFELPDFLVSERLPIGKATVVRHANRKLLKSFYDAWYRPDNMMLVMVGDFSIPTAKPLIESRFGPFTARAAAAQPPVLGHIAHQGVQVFYHHEPEAGGTSVSIETIRSEPPAADTAQARHQRMIEAMADRIVQSRLDSRLKAPETPFTSAAVGSGTYLNHIRYSDISADSSAEKWSQTLAAIEQELRRALLYGFRQEELERVRKDVLKQLDNAVRETPTRNSTTLARSIIHNIAENRVIRSPEQEESLLAPLVASATLEQVQKAFRDNWSATHRLVLVTGNADLTQTSRPSPQAQIRDAFLAAAKVAVSPPEAETATPFPYLPTPADIGQVASRDVLADLGITRIQLANGVRINLKRTDYKTNEVLANLIFGHGRSSEPESRPGLGLLAEPTVNESGLGGMDTDKLERAMAGKSTYVDFRIGETYFNFFAESVSDEMELLFQLLYAHIIDPGFRDDALALARERLHQDYQSASRSIEGMLKIEGTRFLAGGDSRFGMPSSFSAIRAIDLADIRNWIIPQLSSAPLELSIVGDIDEATVIELARRYLGALPAKSESNVTMRTTLPHLPAGSIRRIAVDTQIPKALVVSAWQTEDFWDIHRTRRLSVLADVFSERLRERIREKLGASYSPYAFNRASRAYDGYGLFQAYVNVAPDQTSAVLQEVKAIAADLVRKGVTEDERLRAIDPMLTSIKQYRQTNGYWLNSVMTASGRSPQQFAWARSFVDDFRAITVDELSRLATTYLIPERAAAVVIAPKAP